MYRSLLRAFICGLLIGTAHAGSTPTAEKELKNFIVERTEEVKRLIKTEYQYTLAFNQDMKCVAKTSEIGPVGVCLVNGQAEEEGVTATFAVTVTSHFSGTGSVERELDIKLIDYKL